MACAANYAFANRSSMTFLARQAFSKIFKQSPDDLVRVGRPTGASPLVAHIDSASGADRPSSVGRNPLEPRRSVCAQDMHVIYDVSRPGASLCLRIPWRAPSNGPSRAFRALETGTRMFEGTPGSNQPPGMKTHRHRQE